MDTSAIYAAFTNLCEGETPVPLEERAVRVEVALARSIAWSLPIPAMKVDQLGRTYVTTCLDASNKIISEFNESYPIDVRQVADLTRELWKVRYTLVHQANALSTEGLLMLLANSNSGLDYVITPRYKEVIGSTVPWAIDREISGLVEETLPNVSADNSIAG